MRGSKSKSRGSQSQVSNKASLSQTQAAREPQNFHAIDADVVVISDGRFAKSMKFPQNIFTISLGH